MRTHGNAVSAIDAEFGSTRYQFRAKTFVLEFNNLHGAVAYAYAVTFAFVRVNGKNAQILFLSSASLSEYQPALGQR